MNTNTNTNRNTNNNTINTRKKGNYQNNKLKNIKNKNNNKNNQNNKNTKKNSVKIKIEKIGKCSIKKYPDSNIRKTINRLLEEQYDRGLIVLYDIDTPYGIEDDIGPKKTFVHYLKVGDTEYMSLMEPSPPRPIKNMEQKNTHRYYLSHYVCDELKMIKFLDKQEIDTKNRNDLIFQKLKKGRLADKKMGKLNYKKKFVVYNIRE